MIIARLERKTPEDGRPYLSGRLIQDVKAGTLVILKRDERDPEQYVLWELGERKVRTDTEGFLF